MVRVLAISGSLRAAASNGAIVRAVALMAPEGVMVDVYEGLGALPHFNPDLDEAPFPPAAADWKNRVRAADALLISSPEYARGIPGSLKNALDWLVSETEFYGKPVALWAAAEPPRGAAVEAALRLVLTTMSATLVNEACLALPLLGGGWTAELVAADATMREAMAKSLAALTRSASTQSGSA